MIDYLGKDINIANLNDEAIINESELVALTKKFEEIGRPLDHQEAVEVLMEARKSQ